MEGKGRTDRLNLKKATSWELWPLTQGWSSPVVTHRKKAEGKEEPKSLSSTPHASYWCLPTMDPYWKLEVKTAPWCNLCRSYSWRTESRMTEWFVNLREQKEMTSKLFLPWRFFQNNELAFLFSFMKYLLPKDRAAWKSKLFTTWSQHIFSLFSTVFPSLIH